MTQTADIVVVGGGVMGVSAGYHLAERGARVAVLEAEPMWGMGSTGQNAGGFRHQFSTAVNIELSKLSLSLLERFEEEFDQPVAINLCGYLFLLDAADDVAVFRRNVELQHAHGVMTRWLSPTEIHGLAPAFDLAGIVAGTFYERDGLVDPSGVLQGYVRGASRAGAALHTGTRVTGARIRGGRVEAVETSAGDFSADNYLIAAGPWSAAVGTLLGVDIPVRPSDARSRSRRRSPVSRARSPS